MSYRLAPEVETDVEAIADYVSKFNPRASLRLVEDFMRRWELLATQPYSGAAREDIFPNIRHLVMRQYMAFYRVEIGTVVILRVLHGHRNITAEDIRG